MTVMILAQDLNHFKARPGPQAVPHVRSINRTWYTVGNPKLFHEWVQGLGLQLGRSTRLDPLPDSLRRGFYFGSEAFQTSVKATPLAEHPVARALEAAFLAATGQRLLIQDAGAPIDPLAHTLSLETVAHERWTTVDIDGKTLPLYGEMAALPQDGQVWRVSLPRANVSSLAVLRALVQSWRVRLPLSPAFEDVRQANLCTRALAVLGAPLHAIAAGLATQAEENVSLRRDLLAQRDKAERSLAETQAELAPGRTTWKAAVQALADLPAVAHVEVEGLRIHVITTPRILRAPHLNMPRLLGVYRIQFHGRAMPKIRNLTRRINDFDHPHVHDEEACWGSVEPAIRQALARHDLVLAVSLVFAFLDTANPDDSWGRRAHVWPVVPHYTEAAAAPSAVPSWWRAVTGSPVAARFPDVSWCLTRNMHPRAEGTGLRIIVGRTQQANDYTSGFHERGLSLELCAPRPFTEHIRVPGTHAVLAECTRTPTGGIDLFLLVPGTSWRRLGVSDQKRTAVLALDLLETLLAQDSPEDTRAARFRAAAAAASALDQRTVAATVARARRALQTTVVQVQALNTELRTLHHRRPMLDAACAQVQDQIQALDTRIRADLPRIQALPGVEMLDEVEEGLRCTLHGGVRLLVQDEALDVQGLDLSPLELAESVRVSQEYLVQGNFLGVVRRFLRLVQSKSPAPGA